MRLQRQQDRERERERKEQKTVKYNDTVSSYFSCVIHSTHTHTEQLKVAVFHVERAALSDNICTYICQRHIF